MGNVADDIFSSFGLGNDEKKNYDMVMENILLRNVIFDCAKFNQCQWRRNSINLRGAQV